MMPHTTTDHALLVLLAQQVLQHAERLTRHYREQAQERPDPEVEAPTSRGRESQKGRSASE